MSICHGCVCVCFVRECVCPSVCPCVCGNVQVCMPAPCLLSSSKVCHSNPLLSLFSAGMKTPLSPAHFIEHGRMAFPFGGCLEPNQLTGMEPTTNGQGQINMDLQLQQQEKKKLFYSMCEVCNIQLNSQAQAQVHYNGRSHLKRVKQLNNGESPAPATGSLPTSTLSLSRGTTSSSTGRAAVNFCQCLKNICLVTFLSCLPKQLTPVTGESH